MDHQQLNHQHHIQNRNVKHHANVNIIFDENIVSGYLLYKHHMCGPEWKNIKLKTLPAYL